VSGRARLDSATREWLLRASLLSLTLALGCSTSAGGDQLTGTGGQPASGTGGAGTGGNGTGGEAGNGSGGQPEPGTGGNAATGGNGNGNGNASGGQTASGAGGGGGGIGGRGGTGAGTGGVAGTKGAGGGGAGGTLATAGTSGAAGSGHAGGFSGTGGAVTAPVSDPTSTLGISAPGSGYHVEGNIAYGPYTMQRLDVMYPNAAGPKGTTTLPGVIMFHGGGWIDNKPAALKASMSSFFSRFLKHSFVVCNVEYRLADGTADGAIAPAADEDALLAAKWFWDHMDYYHVDKTRYVTTGASAGGQLALMVGMATPAAQLGPTSPTDYTIAAVVNGYGPSDVTDLLAKKVSFAVQWLPASTPNRSAIAKQVSPVTYVRQDVPPLITVQGDMDTTVPMSESQELFDLLTAAGADTALHFVAGAGHGFTTPSTAWPDAEAAMFNFLVAHGIGK
jgi:acetyl esterase/lipase